MAEESKDLIITTGNFMTTLEDEIKAVKDGGMPLEMARVVGKARDQQIKVLQIEIAWQRLKRNSMRKNMRDRNLITGQEIIDVVPEKTEEKGAIEKKE